MKKYWFFATLATCAAGAAGYVIGQPPAASNDGGYPVVNYPVPVYTPQSVVYSNYEEGGRAVTTYNEELGIPQQQLPPPLPPPLPVAPGPGLPQPQPLPVPSPHQAYFSPNPPVGNTPDWQPVNRGPSNPMTAEGVAYSVPQSPTGQFNHPQPVPTAWAVAAGIAQAPQNGPAKKSIEIFDTNHDGEIGPDEIHDAAQQLKKLDQNQDGKLTANEVRNRGGNAGPQNGNPQRGKKRNKANRNAQGWSAPVQMVGPSPNGPNAPHVMVFRADGQRFSMTPSHTPPQHGPQQHPGPGGSGTYLFVPQHPGQAPQGPQQQGPQQHGPQQHGPQQHGPQQHQGPGPNGPQPQQHGPQQNGPQSHDPYRKGPQQHPVPVPNGQQSQQHGTQRTPPLHEGPAPHGPSQHPGAMLIPPAPGAGPIQAPGNLPSPVMAADAMVELAMTFDHNRDGQLDRDELTKLTRHLHGAPHNPANRPNSAGDPRALQPPQQHNTRLPERRDNVNAERPSNGRPNSDRAPSARPPIAEREERVRDESNRNLRTPDRSPQRDGDSPRDRKPETQREESTQRQPMLIPEFTLDAPAAEDLPPAPSSPAVAAETEVSLLNPAIPTY